MDPVVDSLEAFDYLMEKLNTMRDKIVVECSIKGLNLCVPSISYALPEQYRRLITVIENKSGERELDGIYYVATVCCVGLKQELL